VLRSWAGLMSIAAQVKVLESWNWTVRPNNTIIHSIMLLLAVITVLYR
jgi:hypothetical protein